MVVLAVVRDRLLGPEQPDQLDRFAKPGEALFVIGPYDAESAFVQVLACADPEDDAVRKQRPERPECLGHDCRVIAKGRSHDRGAERNVLCPLAGGGEPGERKRRVAIGMTPRLKVIADEDALESVGFRGDGEIEQLTRAELFGRSLIAEAQHG